MVSSFFSILALLFSISLSILATNSSIEFLLSSKEDTEIFKLVISKFKSSIYFWLSLFNSANSLITTFNSSISLLNFSISCSFSTLTFTIFSFCSPIDAFSVFNLFNLSSSFNISLSIDNIFCFSVA